MKTNMQVLQAAWPVYFDPSAVYSTPTNTELFAQEVEYESGNTWGGVQSPDGYFINAEFVCTRWLVVSLMIYGQIPGQPGSAFPWPTGQGCPAI
jgi:hypothetical protein